VPKGPFPILRTAVLLFIIWIVAIEFPGARDLVRSPYSGIETRNLVVQSINPDSPNAGGPIRRDDEIVEVDGLRVRNYNHLRHLVSDNHDLAPQDYVLTRHGETVTAVVTYIPVPGSLIYRRFASLLVGFTFLLVGLIVLLRRDDTVGLLFSANCAILAFLLTDRPIIGSSWMQLTGELFDDAVMVLFPAVFLHFFLVFHDRPLNEGGLRSRSVVLIYSPPAVLFVFSSVFAVRQFFGVPTPLPVQMFVLIASTLFLAGYLVASLVIFVRNYRSSSAALKQKKRVAILGTVVGIIPFLAVIVWRLFSPGTKTSWEFLSVLALGFVSISFGYAILKHGAIELNIVVRKSIAYAFLSGAVIASYYGLVNLMGDFLTAEFNLRPAYFSMVTILVLAVIFAPARDVVQRAVDRVFLRKEYDYKSEVVEFNREIARKLTRKEILDHFVGRVSALLNPSFVVFYAPSNGGEEWLIDRYGPEGNTTLPADFPKQSLLGRYLTRYRKPLLVEYLDHSWGRRHLDDTSTAFLDRSHAAVCLPLAAGDAVVGLAVLGTKRNDCLYSQTDSQLLERFAEHLGLVLENAELHEASIEQERLRNEVLLAREIQLSLLPTQSPAHPSLEIVGKMVSSAEVGGDYFDYLGLEADRIGVVIGDVSGKGVPAAMLMSSLQAVFKNLALRERMGPAELVGELNGHLCRNAQADQFATFFFGVLDMSTSTFTFSNAGHCPPLHLKRDYADRLGEGGLPLGVDPAAVYQQGEVRIDAGDVVCLYTDGFTEQSNPAQEQFGEQRLIEFLRAKQELPIEALQDALFAAILAFGDGRQDDDSTAIIARRKGA
jgi:sigma-B regulation protein RsbU (phosphoserine phosphatase)